MDLGKISANIYCNANKILFFTFYLHKSYHCRWNDACAENLFVFFFFPSLQPVMKPIQTIQHRMLHAVMDAVVHCQLLPNEKKRFVTIVAINHSVHSKSCDFCLICIKWGYLTTKSRNKLHAQDVSWILMKCLDLLKYFIKSKLDDLNVRFVNRIRFYAFDEILQFSSIFSVNIVLYFAY